MEEQRIGHMYWNLFKSKLQGTWDNLFPKGLRRSPALPVVVIFLLIAIPLAGWMLHMHGKFGNFKREITHDVPAGPPPGPRPGGLDPILLSRPQTPGSNLPEFATVTMLPGLGMDVLQITAFLPNKGEVPLLADPKLEDVANGTTPARNGPNDRWGAIELPWSGLLTGVLAPTGTSIRTPWRNKMIEAPTELVGHANAEGGMLPATAADATQQSPEGHPVTATSTFKAVDFDHRWPSANDVTVTVTLSARTVDLTVMAKNIGDQPEPMGIGWHPRFVIPSGNRDSAEIRLPNGDIMEVAERSKGLPSGKFVPAPPAISRFQLHPAAIGAESIDGILGHLKAAILDDRVTVELRDPASEFGLRLTGMSDSIRELRVTSPSGSNYVGLGTQTNLDDPFGKEWTGADGQPISILQPGQTAEWKMRLEIFSASNRFIIGR